MIITINKRKTKKIYLFIGKLISSDFKKNFLLYLSIKNLLKWVSHLIRYGKIFYFIY